MKYTDKHGNEIKAGMHIRMDDGSIEEVFSTMDQYGNESLGINASNEDYLLIHNTDRGYYSLSNFPADSIEIIPEKEKTITVLVIEPMKYPEKRQIENTLEAMQETVGVLIQPIYPFDEPVSIVCNDEGKIMGLPPNRLLKDDFGKPYDILCGTFFIAGVGAEDFKSLTPKQIDKYTNMFKNEMLLPAKAKNVKKQKER